MNKYVILLVFFISSKSNSAYTCINNKAEYLKTISENGAAIPSVFQNIPSKFVGPIKNGNSDISLDFEDNGNLKVYFTHPYSRINTVFNQRWIKNTQLCMMADKLYLRKDGSGCEKKHPDSITTQSECEAKRKCAEEANRWGNSIWAYDVECRLNCSRDIRSEIEACWYTGKISSDKKYFRLDVHEDTEYSNIPIEERSSHPKPVFTNN